VRDLPAVVAEYAPEIAEIAQAIQGQGDTATAGLWIGKRANRLAELQGEIDDINEAIEQLRAEDGRLLLQFALGKPYQSLLRSKLQVLKSAAEEIDGPRRRDEPSDRNAVHYVLEADDFTASLT
jgi:hypothetical protein